ncbi:MAG: AI-2E family transporter [Candidatus Rokuibacteriota bacterium]
MNPGTWRLPIDRRLLLVATIVLVIGILYWAQAILIPIALATLLAFLLSPVVGALHRVGLGRLPAVALVMLLVVAALGGAGWALSVQFGALAQDLPRHTEALKRRIAELRPRGPDSALDRARGALDEVVGELEKIEQPSEPKPAPAPAPLPVVVKGEQPPLIRRVPDLASVLASVGLVVVLVIFMLIERQALRDRFIRLFGYGRLTLTTKALDDAGSRISRYLLTLSVVNASMGLAFGLGLLLIGVPYALLWGTLLALARFVPYIGVWPAAGLPTALALSVFDGWGPALMVVALFLGLEVLANILVEPVLYSQHAGVSKVALLVAIGFWTWLWGPVGLILATPLTVGLVVLAKYVPSLHPVGVLLGDEPALDPAAVYYQRLVARDVDEATEIVEARVQEGALEAAADTIMIPALAAARRDRAAGRLDDDDQRFLVAATREIVADAVMDNREPVPAEPAVRLLGCPARDEVDAAALAVFRPLLNPALCAVDELPVGLLSAEVVERVAGSGALLVVVASVPPGGVAQTRYLIKRLRATSPRLTILVGRWGAVDEGEIQRAALLAAGAEHVGTTLAETRDQVLMLLPVVNDRAGAKGSLAVGLHQAAG